MCYEMCSGQLPSKARVAGSYGKQFPPKGHGIQAEYDTWLACNDSVEKSLEQTS